MEENYISKYECTHWYLNLIKKTYGVCINIRDLNKANDIIKHFRDDRQEQINAWKQEWKEGAK